ncbi:MAG: aminotransferase class III-fold pyridoxal phosphate-dependent enzyme [Cyclobacteriaceae bacterium]|nr:aminotransferase class III-fold pyridoxal phosphate-dependent enzyme [Cyclobacteriaceae bacterium]
MKEISESDASKFATTHFGLVGTAKKLNGEIDLNFYLKDTSGKEFILKLANAKESIQQLELQNAMMKQLANAEIDLHLQHVIPSINKEDIVFLKVEEGTRFMRVLTWIDGRVLAEVKPHSHLVLYKVGEMCGKLSKGLVGFDHKGAHRFMKWDPAQTSWTKDHLTKFKGEKNNIVTYCYSLFEKNQSVINSLRKSVIYGDANDYNILVSGTGNEVSVPGVIDFGDAVYSNTINELAIALAYVMMHKPDPLEAAVSVVKGYHDQFPIDENELSVLFPLVLSRLLISVTCSVINLEEHPDNTYLQISDTPAWDLLEKLVSISPDFAHYTFRDACGLEPCPLNNQFITWASQNFQTTVFPVAKNENLKWLDLSVGSLDIGNTEYLLDDNLLDRKLAQLMSETNGIAIGRYNEARAFYSTDAFAGAGNDSPKWRTVHTAMDFFTKPGAEVFAVHDGVVQGFANNSGNRNYGPTIILKHKISGELTFYTLSGHLSMDSISNMHVGQAFKKGEMIGRIGAKHENGNWPPHLHFQIILDLLGKKDDFPGVAYAYQREIWKSISPDPWLLLEGKPSEQLSSLTKEEIVEYRKQHLGKNLSISYRDPIKMVRGHGAYLLDDTGRKYLDTVNNVAHVGHEHPRVVAAGQKQMAVLNTNTRYLHENIVKFVAELLSTMPHELDVAFLVNSGSEANELGMRLAKNYTNQKDMIVSEVGYHGNTNGCVEISSYKFDGAGGTGVTPFVHVIPITDVYRGLYRANDPKAGSRYASHVLETVKKIQSQGRGPAALIYESVISCGGQVELPANFLKEAYQHVRHAGGVCMADEVQTGCGRVGNHFWAFQEHDVVPDIVTIGKPIGNGHPLGVVVTTQAIADAFKNGMEYFNTFGGNPVSCAIGLEVLKVIKEEGLQQNAKAVGNYLKSGLRNMMSTFEIIGDVRGPGLFIGFELVKDRETKEPATEQASYLANRMRDKGILMSTDGPFNNVLKIKPPLVFSKSNADFLLDSIAKVLEEDYLNLK